jgi:tRNA A37 threonylcarbamoyltransferase TsaD
MCNVCLAFLSVPVLSFSIKKAGDYIDNSVASVTGEVNTRVRKIKETEFSLSRKPKNDVEDALNIYYEDLIVTLVEATGETVSQNSKLPKFDRSIPIVLSGGTAMVQGFRQRFERVLEKKTLPIEVSKVRLAGKPLYATANGALIASMYEE